MSNTFGFEEFIASLGKLKGEFDIGSKVLLNQTADHAVAEVQGRTPVDTGTLRSSIARGEVTDYSIEIGSSLEYSQFIEEGTRYISPFFMLRDGVTVAEKRFESEATKLFKMMLRGFRI